MGPIFELFDVAFELLDFQHGLVLQLEVVLLQAVNLLRHERQVGLQTGDLQKMSPGLAIT